MKRLLFFICTLLCANVIMAQRFWEGDLKYWVIGAGKVTVDGCDTSATSVNIPSSVTHAWKHYSSSCNCYITDSVRTYSVIDIDFAAFSHSHNLTSVTIPNSVTSIDEYAFSDCSSLTSIDIPNSVTFIGDRAFGNCSSLTTLNFNAINCNDFDYFYNNPFYNTPITTINIGNSVQRIPEDFAYGLDSLTSVTIGNSVTSIGYRAFANCSSLTSVTIGNSVTSIGEMAFYNCSSLTSVTIPNSVTSIGGGAFCFSGLTSVTIPNSVTSIEGTVFSCCYDLTSVTIPNSVTTIEGSAFKYCSSLTSVTIPNSVTTIEGSAFYGCSSLTSIDIPNSVTTIGGGRYGAFENCSSLTSVTIGNSVTSIDKGTFQNCSSLTNLNYNAINCNFDFAFGFDPHPFNNCPISTINIGDSVQIIPGYFAYNLDNLTSITFPNSVTDIGYLAFYGCHRLNSVTCLATNPPDVDYESFYGISTNTLYVPNGCRQVYQNSSWSYRFYCIIELGSNNSIAEIDVEVNNEEWGSVEVNEDCGTATLTAVVEEDCSKFLHWNDGDTNNPRVVNVTSDTSFTAIFKDPVLDTTIDATIMQGETYNFNGQELSEEGVYNATVLSVLGCEINLTINLDVIPNNYTNGETSSLQETELEEIVFYPNPTKGLISFSKSIEKIEVVDISGKILLSFSNVREINIGDLPAGSYLLRLHSNENSVLRKIVKE